MNDFDDGLSEEDRRIWKNYVDEMKGKEAKNGQEEDFATLLDQQADQQVVSTPEDEIHIKQLSKVTTGNKLLKNQSGFDYQLDKRTEEKLKKGKIPIAARLDLHGLSKAQAYEKLDIFLKRCYQENLRCILVITGKGKAKATSQEWLAPSKGVLKEHVPIWLNEGYLKTIVLKYFLAQPKDGGSGALYVYLKKNVG